MALQLDEERQAIWKFEKVINFDTLEKNSDLWLFYQITDLGNKFENLVVLLTPSFDGQVFYTKDVEKNTLTISGTQAGEISMRLTAHRYDHTKWPNLRLDQDGDTEGTHVISSKQVKGTIEGVSVESAQVAAIANVTGALEVISDIATSSLQIATNTLHKFLSWFI